MSTDPATVEAALRIEVAAASRILVMSGILGYSGHLSVRLPGTDTFLVQTFEAPRVDLDPAGLLVVDLDGKVHKGEGRPPAEVCIHTEIYRARSDVDSVAHFHFDEANVLTVVTDGDFVPVKNHAYRWASGVPIYPSCAHVGDPVRGQALAATLGNHNAALLRGHGQVLVAESIPGVLVDSIHFLENIRGLGAARAIGTVLPLTPAELAEFEETFDRGRHVRKLWEYYLTVAAQEGVIPQDWLSVPISS